MSELPPLTGDRRTEAATVPVAEACSPAAVLPRIVTTAAVESMSLLKRLFSFPAMLGTMLVGAGFFAGRRFVVDPDVWWHVKNGQNILDTHRWPTTDPYSFTVAGTPWLSYEWLGDVLF